MSTTRIEAEDLSLSGAYGVSSFSVASNGQGISLPRHQSSSGLSGVASHTFAGNAGSYDLDVGYYKERDGGATIKVAVNGIDQGTIYIYSKSADASPTANSFAIRSYALVLNPGDVITLTAKGHNWSHAVVDYVELTGDGPSNSPPVADSDSATTDQNSTVLIDVLAGDSDSDGGTLSIAALDATGTSGQVANNGTDVGYDPNGQFEYLDQGESATDTFTYTLADGQGGTDTATVTVTVTGLNDAPIAADDTGSTDKATLLTVAAAGLLANDSDPDASDSLIISEVNGSGASVGNQIVLASGALLTVAADGSYAYDPNSQYAGLGPGDSATDSFTYTVTGGNETDTATVVVTVNGINVAPVADGDSATTGEDDSIAIDVLAGDSDSDGGTLNVAALDTTGTSGQVTNNGTGVIYDPNGQFEYLDQGESATDTFRYTTADGQGGTDTATVTVTVTGVDDNPIAVDDGPFDTDEDTPIVVSVLANDSDPDDALTVTSATNGSNGSVTTNGTTVTYSPNTGFTGTDSFTYTIDDGAGTTDSATVTVSVSSTPAGPAYALRVQELDPLAYWRLEETTGTVATDTTGNGHDGVYGSAATLDQDGFLPGSLDNAARSDGASNVAEVAHDTAFLLDDGSISLWFNADRVDQTQGLITKDAYGNGTGGHFRIILRADGVLNTRIQTTSTSHTIQSATDTVTADQWHQVVLNFGSGGLALYLDGQLVGSNSYTGGLGSTSGGVGNLEPFTLGSNQGLSSDQSSDGENGFLHGVLDEVSLFGRALSTQEIAELYDLGINGPPNAPPVADGDSATTGEDSSIAIDVLANDSDSDGGTLSVQSINSTGTTGQVTNNGTDVSYDPNGQFEYLDQGESATDTFRYTTADGQGGTDTATVTVTVTGVDDNPIAVDDGPFDTDEDTPIVVSVLANDSDPDDALTVTSATNGSNGSVTTNGTTVTYSPNTGFTGTDSFTYTIDDGAGTTDSATVTVSVSSTPAGPAYALRVQELDPLAYWRLEETTGTVATDTTGNGHDGVYGSAATLDQDGFLPGSLDNAARSDGASNVAEVAHDTAFLLDDGSISLWFNADRVDQTQGLITKDAYGNGTGGHFRIILRADGVLNTRIQTTSTSHTIQSATDTVTADQWHQVVLNFGSGGLALYLDGQLVGSNSYTGGLSSTSGGVGNLEPFTLGSNQGLSSGQSSDGENGFLHGVLDEVSLFGRALSTQEIAELYDLGINGPPTAPPVADGDSATTDEDSSVAIDVLAGDSDSDGGTLSVDGIDTGATAGQVTNNGTGVTYDPNGQFEYLDQGESATDTFSYTLADGQGGTDTAAVTVTVTGIDDAPVAVDDGPFNTAEGTQIVIPVLANDSDPDDALTVTNASDGSNGTVTTNGTTVTYTPNGGFTGADSFTYTIDDGAGTTDSATVSVNVGAPTINPDELSGLALWLDAADAGSLTTSGASVSAWQDKSGGGHHFTQSSSSSRPDLVTAQSNGLAAVRTDGSNDFLSADFSDLSLDGMTLFIVAAVDPSDADAGIFSVYDDSASDDNDDEDAFVLTADGNGGVSLNRELTDPDPLQLNGLDVDTAPAILVAAMAAATAKLEVNGGADISDTYDDTDPMDPTDATLGARWFGGTLNSGNRGANDYHEVLLYDRVLSNQEIIDVNAYLASKWGLTVGQSDIDFEFVPFAGQSNAYGHFDTASGAGVDRFLSDLAGYTGADSTTAINTASGASAVDRIAAPDWGPTRYWWDLEADAPGPLLTAAIADIKDQGVTPTGIVWAQGEQDGQSLAGYEGTPTTIARYKEATEAVFDYFRSELDLPDLPIYMQHIGGYTGSAGQAAHHPIRQAQSDMANDLDNVFIAASSYDQPLSDNVHFTGAGYATIGARLARYIAHEQGEAGVTYGTGPQIQSAQAQAGNTEVIVTLTHDGGSTFTPTSAIDGFYLEDSGGQVTINSAARQSATEIKLTLSEALNGASTLHYINETAGWDNNDIVTDDATPLSLPLEAASVDIWLV